MDEAPWQLVGQAVLVTATGALYHGVALLSHKVRAQRWTFLQACQLGLSLAVGGLVARHITTLLLAPLVLTGRTLIKVKVLADALRWSDDLVKLMTRVSRQRGNDLLVRHDLLIETVRERTMILAVFFLMTDRAALSQHQFVMLCRLANRLSEHFWQGHAFLDDFDLAHGNNWELSFFFALISW